MSNTRDPMRLRQGLNPLLTTSLGVYQNHHVSTPLSATSMASGHPFSARTPSSAIQPYNPQEWIGSPVAGPERTHQFPIPDAQVTPPPPPPYSPPRNQQPVSQSFEPPSANTSAARIPPTNVHRPSPEPATTSFPPPPGANGRGASRDRRFGLPSLSRRKDHEQATSPPEPHPPVSLSRPTIHIQIPTQIQRTDSASSQNQPPSARRASSMSAVESTPTSARSRSTSQSRWGPGMPLPPPPPGPPPPPSQSRSQSVQSGNRQSDPAAPIISPPTRRPPPSGVAALGPVPPTPANWVDNDVQPNPDHRNRSPGLTLDTASVDSSQHTADSNSSGANNTSTTPQSGTLARARAVRHDKTIIQRRTESRTRGGSRSSMDFGAPGMSLSEIVVPATTTLARRLQVSKTTPRSGDSRVFDSPSSADHDSRHSTPRPLGSAHTPYTGASTPPFSPQPTKATPSSATEGSPSGVPKALPTPPPQTRSASSSRSRYGMPTPGTEAAGQASASSVATVTKHIVVTQTADQFCRGTIERFQAFAVRESQVASDADRVRLFADFIVSESRIRRERYSSAIGAMGSEIFDLTRDLFRPMTHRRESNASQSEWTPQSSEPTRSQRGSMTSNFRPDYQSNSAPPSANLPQSPTGSTPQNQISHTYMPSLSPILSLSMSGHDETSSRGRPSSRWWEVESNGGGPAGPRFERSKRESKYMSVPKEAREALQWTDTPRSGTYGDNEEQPPGSASEYPPEKTGWHDAEQMATTPQALRNSGNSTMSGSVPNTPNPAAVDVSRLVTLPPPYPRHHPAVNNNHPDLTSIRVSVRAISDLAEIEATKQRFQASSAKAREEAAKAAQERKQSLRANLQTEINQGNMTYAEAGAIEADSAESEKEKTKELQRRDFEQFQSQVVMPLNELLTARIGTATALFNDLAGRLFDASDNAADMPQEEGDDKPELLEKLTLLKWIFEAREMLHRAIYDVLSDRNDRYRDVVLTPYRLSGNEEKVRSAEAFFAQDAARRQCDFAKEVLARTGEFRAVVEENVLRGVEVQLGAFWDIAPALRRLLDDIPTDLGGFAVQIPAVEYDENPSYHAHPLQYLFSLLLHAEKSTYQLIESQTNLLCLLHEVKEAATHAKARVVGAETEDAEGRPVEPEERERRAAAVRREEEERLTRDLKERVRVVQDQWTSALGEGIQGAKERIGEWLLQTGGWDESLEDGDVGGV